MPRPQFSLTTLLWLTVVVAAFCAGTQLDRYLEEYRADPRETSIRAALDEKTELDFADQPLEDVINYLRQRHEIEIQLDGKALADAGIGSDVPITRSVKGITLRSALRLLLSDLDLTYVIQNGVLMITTKAQSTLFSLKTALWLMAGAAVLLGAIQCDRAWRRRAS
jgi:hypothetical protein